MPTVTRRTVFAAAGAAALGAAGAPPRREEAAPSSLTYPYALPPLGYDFAANEPTIDAETMQLHHDKHHAAYVKNLNDALKDHGQAASLPLTDLLARTGELPEEIRAKVRNNAGGHANHTMFWTLMAGKGGQPSGELAAAIDRDFGGLPALRDKFDQAGAGVFGSGWVFVTAGRDGKLALTTRPNQDTPLMDGGRVLFGNDCWEHAYYLKYQNRRADYLAAWWNVVNWPAIEDRYRAAKDGTLAV